MPRSGTRKCPNCHTFFKPDPRTRGKQKYCSSTDCKKAGKADRQQKWLAQPKNRDYFRGEENVQRVRQWRSENPGYWKNAINAVSNGSALQDGLTTQVADINNKTDDLKLHALQDDLLMQPTVLIGLIAHLTGSQLQDDIVSTTLKLQQLGEDFLHPVHQSKGEKDETNHLTQSRQTAGNPQAVQLGRSPPGP